MEVKNAIEILQESKRQNEIMRDNPTIFWRSIDMEAGIQNAQRRIEAINTAITALRSMQEAGEPFHIDRSKWTAEWVNRMPILGAGDLETRCNSCGNLVLYETDFCPYCGKAMTEEAWAELERRLRG